MLKGSGTKVLVIAFKSDWLYPAYQSQEIVRACKLAGLDATYCEIDSSYGHDAFLLEADEETHLISTSWRGSPASAPEAGAATCSEPLKLEHRLILELIPHGSSVLDLGCGDGELLSALVEPRRARAARASR